MNSAKSLVGRHNPYSTVTMTSASSRPTAYIFRSSKPRQSMHHAGETNSASRLHNPNHTYRLTMLEKLFSSHSLAPTPDIQPVTAKSGHNCPVVSKPNTNIYQRGVLHYRYHIWDKKILTYHDILTGRQYKEAPYRRSLGYLHLTIEGARPTNPKDQSYYMLSPLGSSLYLGGA